MVIRPLSPEEIEGKTTSFGIIIPDTAKEKPEQGTVVAVGAGKYVDGKLVAPAVKVGDKVMFSKYGFDEIKVEGPRVLHCERGEYSRRVGKIIFY